MAKTAKATKTVKTAKTEESDFKKDSNGKIIINLLILNNAENKIVALAIKKQLYLLFKTRMARAGTVSMITRLVQSWT